MGRRKIQIKPMKEGRNRYVTFMKRKGGLFKKAHELAVLCQVDLALVIVTPDGKVYEYSTSPDPADVFDKRQQFTEVEHKRPSDYGAGSPEDDDEEEEESSEHSKPPTALDRGLDESLEPGQQHNIDLGHGQTGGHHDVQLRGHHKQHSSQQSIEHSSRPKLTVQIPMLGDEPGTPPAPGPLTALGAADAVADVGAAEARVASVVQPVDPQPAISHRSSSSLGGAPSSIQSHAHRRSSSSKAVPGAAAAQLDAGSRLDPLAAQISPGHISQLPGHSEGSGPASLSRQQPNIPHQQMVQPHFPLPQRFDQRGIPLSPSAGGQGFQPPMGYQNFFNQGIPVGYGYAAPPGYGQASSSQKQSGLRPGPPAGIPHGVPHMAPPIPVAGPAGVVTPGTGNTSAGGNPASSGGRWSGYPQSPMTYFMPPQGEQSGAPKTEPGPVSAVMPSRYMNEMISPSNYFSLEWGAWDPQASAYPGGTARIIPPQNVPSSEKGRDQGSPSPMKHDVSYDTESQAKRRRAS